MKKASQTQEIKLFITAEQDGFTIVSNNITRNTFLSDGAKALYIYLKSHSDNFNLSAQSIAEYLHKSIRTIKSQITELKQSGFLVLERKPNANVYYYKLLSSPKLENIKSWSVEDLHKAVCKGDISFEDLSGAVNKKLITLKEYEEIIKRVIKTAKNRDFYKDE